MSSIKDVAAEARVSLGTVSKVLNERSDASIPFATRERVRLAARRMDYHPSALARGLAGKRMNTIGVVMAYSQDSVTSDAYLGPCIDGILACAKSRGQKVTLFLENDWQAAEAQIAVYGEGNCDGLLVVIPRTASPFLARLQERLPRLPFVLVGDSRYSATLTCADLDNVAAARQATGHLLSLGHRRIAAFCGNRDFCSNDQRLDGYRQALQAEGVEPEDRLIFEGEYHSEWGARNAERLLEQFAPGDRPTAVFCFCDVVAFGAMDVFAARGVRVPEDMAVIGIDDAPLSAARGLTTIRQRVRGVAVAATETLLGRIAGTTARGHRELLAPELIVRASTGAALE